MKDYLNCPHKRIVRGGFFAFFKHNKSLVGLCGPNISEYIKFCNSYLYNKVQVWEKDKETIALHRKLRLPKYITYAKGDILDAKIRKNTTYDLDFCCTIFSCREHVKKFKDNCIFTFAIRGKNSTKDNTLETFFTIRGEYVIDVNTRPFIQSNEGLYMVDTYNDSGTPMMMIAKIKNNERISV